MAMMYVTNTYCPKESPYRYELLKYELKTGFIEVSLFGCHSNQATIEVTYVADLCCPQKTYVPNVNLTQLKTMKLLMCKCGCHGKQATIARILVANPYCP